LGAYSINPSFGATNKKLVEKAHEKNMKVFVWTVNKKEKIEKMKLLRVDGIFSDFPDRLE
jgi:glycerophosphoryl diester phosphodiesterase